ncbi:MAG: hypothetical protein EOO73_09930 [Myxococcales bacterium]|nr:MAG: hypothetical protein EOO73_09930 [Myxococcales bacterium]
MRKSIWSAGVGAFLLLASAAACSGNSSKDDGAGGGSNGSACTAGASRCDGLNVKVCNEDGTAETIQATCLPSQSCSDGACRETACVPNTRFCKDGSVWRCDSTGGGSTLAQSCAGGLFCRDADGDATCSAQACFASEPLCNGSVATVCQATGAGPRPGGTDCSETGQACYQGECRDVSCTAGMKVCQHDDVYLCAQNGTDTSLLADCRDDEVCDPAMGACRAKVCDPGKSACDGSRVTTCNEYGSAWLSTSTDCGATGNVCASGSCKKQVCSPNRSFCNDGAVYSCDSTGSLSTLSETCNPQWYHCAEYSSYAYCASNQCHAGDVFCDGNVIKTCAADGSIPQTGTACKTDEYCSEATCKPLGCTLGQSLCKDSDVYYCDYNGPYLAQDCVDQTVCQLTPNGATCAALPCDPGGSVCLANKVGTCAADGQTLSKVTEDCTASASICGADLKCAKTAVDTIGAAESVDPVSSTMFVGDVIDVTSARKLTEMSMNLVLAGARELRWVVFEQTGTQFTARVDKVVSNVSGAGFISSGPLTHSLKAGKRYLLGVAIGGGDGVAYYDTAPYTRNLSFGTLLGRVLNGYSPSLDASYYYPELAYQMKTTTEVP